MPTGYIPARKKPVPNLAKKRVVLVIVSANSNKLQRAANKAHIKKTVEGENWSAIIKRAKVKVPIINPI